MCQGPLIHEVSRSHSDTPHTVGLLWTSHQPVAETSTRQHTTFIRERHSCSGGIQIRNPSKKAAAHPHLRPLSQWDWLWKQTPSDFILQLKYSYINVTELFVQSWNSICRLSFLLVRLLGTDKRRNVKIPRFLKVMITKSEKRAISEFILNQCLSYALFVSVTTLHFSVELYNECHEHFLPLHSQSRRCLQIVGQTDGLVERCDVLPEIMRTLRASPTHIIHYIRPPTLGRADIEFDISDST